ncbi:ATPase RavA [Pirellula sp. SH-Sr6A]|uniref:AAA family ATPase n=1 Tax=Pirellula sp. SH-Sr6A TaxID=1632865 RepID=UPI00078EBD37|nr:MoxR family ATPase [Pirellula sp. SH-Sr6A]AMV33511.1 ATPase RavA [Pirellula sp. SH-Sr6A]
MANEIPPVLTRLEQNIESVVLGKKEVVRRILIALLAGEHLLLEDVPGVGKTLLAKAIAKSIDGKFTRVQFTPDLLPSDIIGSSIYHNGEFKFSPGPIFANVVLGDEINRAPPRTQSALLEAMSEHQASVDGKTYPLPDPFLVIATQNPFEFEGTYVLPESQLDRFIMRIDVGYPGRDAEKNVLKSHQSGEPVDALKPVASIEEIKTLQQQSRAITVEDTVIDYLLEIVEQTRRSNEIQVGVSTRGTIAYYRAAQAHALISGRKYVVPDDVKSLAIPVLAHRIMPRGFTAGSERSTAEAIIERCLRNVDVPL